MKKLNNNEMEQIMGGMNWVAVTIGSAVVSFLVGIFEGIVNPKKCNS